MTEHLGYEKHDPKGRSLPNARNWASPKTLKTEQGPVEIEVPRRKPGAVDVPFNRRQSQPHDTWRCSLDIDTGCLIFVDKFRRAAPAPMSRPAEGCPSLAYPRHARRLSVGQRIDLYKITLLKKLHPLTKCS